ncbi:formate dehydrogenase accessory sulfurtransferase FdhD [Dongshaea marina]|uniref:formate dehydrogenase accessory sulfurtransferase FdhD n=1 Tax=Dongshaea marina TaxID=2047966 RepID=UPI000D3ECE48|nr:formate dehydrogenase accessory sulfurtransferase FdhD [Dongshaea marina]
MSCRSSTEPCELNHLAMNYTSLEDDKAQPVELVNEVPIAISLNGVNHAVMMISPTEIEPFLLGFIISEGIVKNRLEVQDIEWQWEGGAIVADITLSHRADYRVRAHRRALAGRTGCGLCGIDSLSAAFPDLPELEPARLPQPKLFEGLRDRVRDFQSQGGAMHAALYMDSAGELLFCSEDVGRHNALDKLIGQLQQQQIDTRAGVVLMTSRCSIELVQKSIRSGLECLVTMASPTTLAVELARKHGLNLLHLPQRSQPRVYSPAP